MRKTSTAAAVAVVTVALLVGGLILLLALQTALTTSTDASARQKVQDVVAELDDLDVLDASKYITDTAHPGQYVQLLDAAGYVVASSEPIAAYAPLSSQRPAPGQVMTQDVSSLPSIGDGDDYHIVTVGTRVLDADYTVVVAQAAQIQADTLATVAWFLFGATPLLLAVVAVSVWTLVGRSLAQVERIRHQVAEIDAERLDGRVEVPPSRDEIQALALTMNGMLDRLQAADREQRRFVSDASHELRSPLATLSAGVEIAAADPSGAMWLRMRDVLAEETHRLSFLVDDLLTLSRSADGGLQLDLVEVDLDDVVEQEIRRLRSTSRHRIEAEIIPVRIRADARRLGQVLRNILDNAERHAASRITVRLSSTADAAVLTVDNDGDTIPPPERERVFQRFVRLDDSRSREGGGSGLGLAIAAGIIAAHHGSIRATEDPDGNCRFEVRLPGPDPVLAAALTPRGARRPRTTGADRR